MRNGHIVVHFSRDSGISDTETHKNAIFRERDRDNMGLQNIQCTGPFVSKCLRQIFYHVSVWIECL